MASVSTQLSALPPSQVVKPKNMIGRIRQLLPGIISTGFSEHFSIPDHNIMYYKGLLQSEEVSMTLTKYNMLRKWPVTADL